MQDAPVDVVYCISSFLNLRDCYPLFLTCRSFSCLLEHPPFFQSAFEIWLKEDIAELSANNNKNALANAQRKKKQYFPPLPPVSKKLKRKPSQKPAPPKFNFKELLQESVIAKIIRNLEKLLFSQAESQPGVPVWSNKWKEIITFAKEGEFKWKVMSEYFFPVTGKNVIVPRFITDLTLFHQDEMNEEPVSREAKATLVPAIEFVFKFNRQVLHCIDHYSVAQWVSSMSEETLVLTIPYLKQLLATKLKETVQDLIQKQKEEEEEKALKQCEASTTLSTEQHEPENELLGDMPLDSMSNIHEGAKSIYSSHSDLPFGNVACKEACTTKRLDLILEHELSDPIYFYQFTSLQELQQLRSQTSPRERLLAHPGYKKLTYTMATYCSVDIYKYVKALFPITEHDERAICNLISSGFRNETAIDVLEDFIDYIQKNFSLVYQQQCFYEMMRSVMLMLTFLNPERGWTKQRDQPLELLDYILKKAQPLSLATGDPPLMGVIITADIHITCLESVIDLLKKYYSIQKIEEGLEVPFSSYANVNLQPALCHREVTNDFKKLKLLLTSFRFKHLSNSSLYASLPTAIARPHRLALDEKMEILELLYQQGCNLLTPYKHYEGGQEETLITWSQQTDYMALSTKLQAFLQEKGLV